MAALETVEAAKRAARQHGEALWPVVPLDLVARGNDPFRDETALTPEGLAIKAKAIVAGGRLGISRETNILYLNSRDLAESILRIGQPTQN